MSDFNPLNNNDIVGSIICEETRSNVEFKIQDENKNGFVIAEGIVQEADEVNRNRRFYPLEELAMAVKAPRQQELVSTGNFKGEAGHPLDQTLSRQSKIDPNNEQVWYTKLWMEGPYVKAWFRGTNNELGKSFNADLKDGQRPSFSLRALGSLVNENGRMTVRNMQMVTYDRVYFPSHSKAYTTKILTTEAANNKPTKYFVANEDTYLAAKQYELDNIVEKGNCPISESIIIPLTQNEINAFIIQESSNVKSILNQFEILYESIELNPDMNTVKMKTKFGDIINISLEKAIKREIIDEVFRNF